MLPGPLFWYCEIQGFHTVLGLRRLEPHQGSALDLSGAYNVPKPPVMLSNDLQSLHILSKTQLSIPHLLGGGGKILSVFCRGEENFLTLPLQENYIPPPPPPTHTHIEKMIRPQYQASFQMKFFMSSLTFNILSQKCSDERKFGIESLQYLYSIMSKNGGNRWCGCQGNRCFVMKSFQMIH